MRGSRPSRGRRALLCTFLTGVLAGCTGAAPPDNLAALAAPIVYGDDDRAEYFDATAEARSRVSESVVALVPKSRLDMSAGAATWQTSTYGESAGLCDGEPFAEQPSLAFCSGVLVDWDLVLTAGHCLRLLGPDDFVVVLGYYYTAPGELELTEEDVFEIEEVLAEAVDPYDAEPRLDYGWLRLNRATQPPRRPTPLHAAGPAVQLGDALLTVSSAGGVPLKIDAGASVRDARDTPLDYFVADTDTSHGSSGGPAFGADLSLVGILARGGADFIQTESGCNTTVRVPEAEPEEHFTYAFQAVAGLCEAGIPSSICRADCGEPCEALPPVAGTVGCGLSRHTSEPNGSWLPFSLVLLAQLARVASRSRPRRPSVTTVASPEGHHQHQNHVTTVTWFRAQKGPHRRMEHLCPERR